MTQMMQFLLSFLSTGQRDDAVNCTKEHDVLEVEKCIWPECIGHCSAPLKSANSLSGLIALILCWSSKSKKVKVFAKMHMQSYY